MRIILIGMASLASVIQTAPAQAQFHPPGQYDRMDEEGINEPYEPPRGLNFAKLKASMPKSVLPHPSGSAGQTHLTLAQQLTEATAIIRAAIPAGMVTADAAAKLRSAGAACGRPKGDQLVCHYYRSEHPEALAYSNEVRWQILFGVSNGKITDLAVSWR